MNGKRETEMAITFRTFQTTREAIDDARELPDIRDYYEDATRPVPIFIYVGGFYIERLNAENFGLPLENTYQVFPSLEVAERALWNYAEAELGEPV